MNRLVIFFSCFLFFGTLAAQDKPSSSEKASYTQISGTIRNVSSDRVRLTFFSDMISFAEELYEVPLDSLNRFSMRFQQNEPTQVNFDYMGQSLRLFLEPGDDLKLRFDGANFYKTLVIEGKGTLSNYYLQQAYRLFGHWDEEHLLYEMMERSPSEFRRYMDGLRRQRWSFLKQFPGKEKFSENFEYYAAADIDYWWAYYLLRYQMEHSVGQDFEKEGLPAHYYNFLNDLVISNDRATSNPYYLYFLDQYLLYQNGKKEEVVSSTIKPVNIRVDVPSLFVMTKPEKRPIVTQVKKGDRIRYLNEKSTFKSKILIKEALHEDYWYKVKTGDGHIGWVIGVGLIFEEPEKIDSSFIDENQPKNRFRTALQHLEGKALYYTLANDLYFRGQNMPVENFEKEFAEFALLNPIKSYDQILGNALASAQRAAKKEVRQGSTNYQIISKPEILSAKVNRGVVVNDNLPEKREITDLEKKLAARMPEDASKMLEDLMEEKYADPKDSITNKEEIVAAISSSTNKSEPSQTKGVSKTRTSYSTDYIEIPLPKGERSTSKAQCNGRLESLTGAKLKLSFYADPITFTEEVKELKLNRDNSFEVNFDLAGPQIGVLAYGEKQTPIYLEPGDKLNIRFNGVHFYKTLHFTGQGNLANNYLLAKKNRFNNEEEELRLEMKNANPTDFLKYMEEQKTLRLQFLGNYEAGYDFSPEFGAYAKAEIEYWYAYQLMNYPWEHPLHHGLDAPMKVPENYYEFLQHIEVSNAKALKCQQYIYFLEQYFDYLLDLPENSSSTKMQLAEQYLNGEVLHFYKARYYTIACKRGKAKTVGLEIRDFIASSTNETYNDVLRIAYNDAKGLVKGMEAPDFTLMDIYGRPVSLNQFKGKVIFLDFWASWCSPCVMQMRNSKGWKSTFKGKEVAFVYVSLDKNAADWRNFVKTLNGTSGGVHLITDSGGGYQSKIAKRYHIKRLPNVLIIDKNGKIFHNSAKDTTNRRLSDLISDLLD